MGRNKLRSTPLGMMCAEGIRSLEAICGDFTITEVARRARMNPENSQEMPA